LLCLRARQQPSGTTQDPYFFTRSEGRLPANLFLVLHDVTDCLLPSNSFDLAYLGQVHYFYYPRAKLGVSPPLAQVVAFYTSLARALKPGGRMVILDWSENNSVLDTDHGHVTHQEVAEQMKRAGFSLLRYEELHMTEAGCEIVTAQSHRQSDKKLHSFFIFQTPK
jgi:hypothetical protein